MIRHVIPQWGSPKYLLQSPRRAGLSPHYQVVTAHDHGFINFLTFLSLPSPLPPSASRDHFPIIQLTPKTLSSSLLLREPKLR